jgi:hypothetical protein
MGALAIIGLAFCVFMWGLQYKLSLYDPPQAPSHHIPKAKLLSKNEQSSAIESPGFAWTRTSTETKPTLSTFVLFVLLLTASIFNLPLSAHWKQCANLSWLFRRHHLRTYFVRPPPVLA